MFIAVIHDAIESRFSHPDFCGKPHWMLAGWRYIANKTASMPINNVNSEYVFAING